MILPFEHQELLEFGDLLQQLTDSPEEMAIPVLLHLMRTNRLGYLRQRLVLDKCFEVIHVSLRAQNNMYEDIFPIMTTGHKFDVVGVALTILFSPSHGFDPTIHSCNMHALKHIKSKFPNSVLFRNDQLFTPIHGVAAAAASNTEAFEFFINWHLEQNPWGCGGFYEVNDAGLTPVHILIDTQADITPSLDGLQRRGLINTDDVEGKQNLRKDGKNLIHFASQTSSLQTLAASKYREDLTTSFKLSFEKRKILDTKNEQEQSRNVKQGTQVTNEKNILNTDNRIFCRHESSFPPLLLSQLMNQNIILNPDVGQAQTSIPTKWFLEIMNNNFQKYKVANIAEKKDIANDILAKVKERGYSFCRYNRDIDKLVAVENSGRRYIGHIRQMFVRMA